MAKKKVEKSTNLGKIAFILLIVAIIIPVLIIIPIYFDVIPYSLPLLRLLWFLVSYLTPALVIMSLILSIVQMTKKPTKLSLICLVSIVIILSFISFFLWTIYSRIDSVPTAECSEVAIRIERVNKAADTVTLVRLERGGDVEVVDVKVAAGGEVLSLGGTMAESETRTIDFSGTFDINTGTVVETAAVVNYKGESLTCPVTDRVKVS